MINRPGKAEAVGIACIKLSPRFDRSRAGFIGDSGLYASASLLNPLNARVAHAEVDEALP